MQKTKQLILEVSLKLFAQKGFNAVSVRDIASELSLSQSALYKHYKSKQDIFDSIILIMQDNDTQFAKEFGFPLSNEIAPQDITLEQIKNFCYRMFCYWTKNEFASNFRKFLTIEQYRFQKSSDSFNNYILLGPLSYLELLLKPITDNFESNALALYSICVFLMSAFDHTKNKKTFFEKAKEEILNYKLK